MGVKKITIDNTELEIEIEKDGLVHLCLENTLNDNIAYITLSKTQTMDMISFLLNEMSVEVELNPLTCTLIPTDVVEFTKILKRYGDIFNLNEEYTIESASSIGCKINGVNVDRKHVKLVRRL